MRYLLIGVVCSFMGSQWSLAQDQVPTGIVAKNGVIRGRIYTSADGQAIRPAKELRMLLIREGEKVGASVTNASGEFEFSDVKEPGVYGIYGQGAEGFVAFATTVLSEASDIGEDEYQLEALAIPATYNESLNALVKHQIFLFENPGYDPKKAVQQFNEVSGLANGLLSTPVSARRVKYDLASVVPSAIAADPLYLNPNGDLVATIQPRFGEDSRMDKQRAFLIQDESELQEVWLNGSGTFTFTKVAPGFYGLVIVGQEGFAATQIEVRQADSQARLGPEASEFVSFQDGTNSLSISFLNATDFQPIPDGGAGDSGSGDGAGEGEGADTVPGDSDAAVTGTGGGGGGGLLGPALGAAGLGTGIGALASQSSSPN